MEGVPSRCIFCRLKIYNLKKKIERKENKERRKQNKNIFYMRWDKIFFWKNKNASNLDMQHGDIWFWWK